MIRRAARIIAVAGLLAAPAAAFAAPAPSPTAQSILRADQLSVQWGRCPTARPAAALLRQARRPAPAAVAARRARTAVAAWETVAAECSRPVAMPVAIPAEVTPGS